MKNKKLFAILTLVCFMFTLMPVAAFAATTYVDVAEEDTLVKVSEEATVTVSPLASTTSVYVFATNAAGSMTKDINVVDSEDYENSIVGVEKIELAAGTASFEVSFDSEGTYSVYVVAVDDASTEVVTNAELTRAQKVALLKDEAYKNLTNEIKVKASKTDYHFSEVANCEPTEEDDVVTFPDAKSKINKSIARANGVDDATVVLYLHNADGDPVVGAKVTISTNSSAVNTSKTEVTTNAAGQVKFDVTANIAGEYEVYVEYGNKADVTVKVTAGTTGPAAIATKYPGSKVDLDTDLSLTDMMFTITDINGNIVKGVEVEGYEDDGDIFYPGVNGTDYYVKVVTAPAGSAVTNEALEDAVLMYDANEAAWYLYGVELDEEGLYEIKVVLANGAFTTSTVTVSEFQTPVDIRLEYKAPSVELNGYNYMKDLKFIDANGVKTSKGVDEIKLAANGYAVDKFGVVWDAEGEEYVTSKGTVKAKADEKYVGQTITVTAVSTKYNLTKTTTMVVANEASAVKYVKTTADVAVNNTLTANIVDQDGNKVAVNADLADLDISYVVLEKPENAKVAVTTQSDGNLASKGEFKVSFTASAIGEYKVQTIVTYEQADGVVKYYSGIETITVGNTGFEDIVVFSIGSNEVIVNDTVKTIEVAPFISNGRTMVPYRALTEAFGATVAYDEATQSVTAELDGTTVVMTIGSATYTVNGVEATADVAPFIQDGRTIVPVRFIVTAFGINPTYTTNADGSVADVLFAK